jgi:hypothetical protein
LLVVPEVNVTASGVNRIIFLGGRQNHSKGSLLMKKTRTLITGYCAVFTLALTVASHAAAGAGTHELSNLSHTHGPDSDLWRDEINLARDIRILRHDLRRGLSPVKIAEERKSVGEDWRQIVLDRDPHALERGGPIMQLARLRRHVDGSTKGHS